MGWTIALIVFVIVGLGLIASGSTATPKPKTDEGSANWGLAFVVLVFGVCGGIALFVFYECVAKGSC